MSQYMLLSLPNSGSDWLMGIIAKQPDMKYYHKEFFNPICNATYRATLETVFGCELIGSYRNIAIPSSEQSFGLESAYRATWNAAEFNLNKEVYSPCKLPFFNQHFRCAILQRQTESLFPPSRLRVLAWYDAIWHSLLARNQVYGYPSLEHRAKQAHEITANALFSDAFNEDVPVISYDLLMTASIAEVQKHLDCGWIGLDWNEVAKEVIATRVCSNKTQTRTL